MFWAIALLMVFGWYIKTIGVIAFLKENLLAVLKNRVFNWKKKSPKIKLITHKLKMLCQGMLLSLLITAKYFRRYTITFGYAAERWFRWVLVGTDIPCWPNYYSLLLPQSIIVRDSMLESANVIRWWRWTPAGSEVDYQGMCHRPDQQQMAAKWLHQSQGLGLSASIYRFEFRLMRDGLFLTGFGKMWLFFPCSVVWI